MNKKVSLVTGGSKGIGLAAAKALHELGHIVIIAARNEEQLNAAIASFNSENVKGIVADVSNTDSVAVLFSYIEQEFGRLDLLFNNAGNNSPAVSIEEIPFEEWQRVFDVNIHASFLCAQQAIKLMKKQVPMGGRIINNGSVSAKTPRLFSAAYTASKHAVTGLTKSISLDCRKYNIACGQINIGNAETGMSNRMRKGVLQADGTVKPEAMMNVADIGSAIAFMAELPITTNALELTIIANEMPFVGRG